MKMVDKIREDSAKRHAKMLQEIADQEQLDSHNKGNTVSQRSSGVSADHLHTTSTQAVACFCVNGCGTKLTSRNKSNQGEYKGWCKKCAYRDELPKLPTKEDRVVMEEIKFAKIKIYRQHPSSGRKEYLFDRYLQNTYHITAETYYKMLAKQGGKCAICKRKPVRLCIDHNHKTGKVRGLLCPRCNSSLGLIDLLGRRGMLVLFRYLGWSDLWSIVWKHLSC